MRNRPKKDILKAIRSVVNAPPEANFLELVTLSGLSKTEAFRDADLSGINLRGLDLRSFRFDDTWFHGCDLRGTDLRGTGARRENATDAKTDSQTQFGGPRQYDIANLVLSHLSNFAVGLIKTVEGVGSEVIGSGTLVSIEGRHGILTCGHVAEVYEKLPEIGLARFAPGGGLSRQILPLGNTLNIILQSSNTWSKKDLDLAFTFIPLPIAASLKARWVFLNIEKNREKIEGPAPTDGKHADAMLGLVGELSDTPFKRGNEIISPMQGVLHTGHIRDQENGLLTFEPMNYELEKLPKSFGGMSGAGLWRIYFDEKSATIVQAVLVGVAAWEDEDGRKITCQGWDRIDQGLIPTVRKDLPSG